MYILLINIIRLALHVFPLQNSTKKMTRKRVSFLAEVHITPEEELRIYWLKHCVNNKKKKFVCLKNSNLYLSTSSRWWITHIGKLRTQDHWSIGILSNLSSKHICIYQPIGLEQDVTQSQFFKWSLTSYYSVFLLLDWLLLQGWRIKEFCTYNQNQCSFVWILFAISSKSNSYEL